MTHNQLTLQANRIEGYKAYEQMRHNKVAEGLNEWINQETKRHNVATETETNRHQNVAEELERSKNTILNYQATETTRHNLAMESIQRDNINVEYYKAQETARHNREQESINSWLAANDEMRVYETQLHNRNTEVIESRKANADQLYKAAAASNQASQKRLNEVKTTTEKALQVPKTVDSWEGVILKPFESISQQFSNYANGVGSLIRGASGAINSIGGRRNGK